MNERRKADLAELAKLRKSGKKTPPKVRNTGKHVKG
jgi:hypothetical protein